MATAKSDKATRVHPVRLGPESDTDPEARMELLEKIAWLMDHSLRIPGTGIRFGVDSLLGLVPIGGDAAGALVQAGLVAMGLYYYKVPRSVAAKMVLNILLDMGIGSIPLLGDLFDVYYKSNRRNVDLLRDAVKRGRR